MRREQEGACRAADPRDTRRLCNSEASPCRRAMGYGPSTPAAHLPSASLGHFGTPRVGHQRLAELPIPTSLCFCCQHFDNRPGQTRDGARKPRRQACPATWSSPRINGRRGGQAHGSCATGLGHPAARPGPVGSRSLCFLSSHCL